MNKKLNFWAAMATWGLEKIDIPQAGKILDIGCGGGANIARLLARSKEANVTGVDYSSVSVAKASKVNADGGTFLIVNEDDGEADGNPCAHHIGKPTRL